jgi:hypothetical protein
MSPPLRRTEQNRKEQAMHIEEKVSMRVLAEARRWLNAHGLRRFELTDAERVRRVEVYRQQVDRNGHITAFLPPPDKPGMKRRRMPVRHPQWRGFAY